jgi:hypothetical protein
MSRYDRLDVLNKGKAKKNRVLQMSQRNSRTSDPVQIKYVIS